MDQDNLEKIIIIRLWIASYTINRKKSREIGVYSLNTQILIKQKKIKQNKFIKTIITPYIFKKLNQIL